jgi:hypothetical protein
MTISLSCSSDGPRGVPMIVAARLGSPFSHFHYPRRGSASGRITRIITTHPVSGALPSLSAWS